MNTFHELLFKKNMSFKVYLIKIYTITSVMMGLSQESESTREVRLQGVLRVS
jgi:hypothetical protein